MDTLYVSILAYLFGLFGSIPPAGPIAVLIVSRATERRYESALRIGLGAAVAEGIYAFLAFWGFATFLGHGSVVLLVTNAITAVVLGALGVRFAVWKDQPRAHRKHRGDTSGFRFGFSISALNPTLLATWSAATAALYSKQVVSMRGYMAIPFAIFAAAGVATWAGGTVYLLERYRKKVPAHALVLVVRAMGILLIGFAAWSAIELVRLLRSGHPG